VGLLRSPCPRMVNCLAFRVKGAPIESGCVASDNGWPGPVDGIPVPSFIKGARNVMSTGSWRGSRIITVALCTLVAACASPRAGWATDACEEARRRIATRGAALNALLAHRAAAEGHRVRENSPNRPPRRIEEPTTPSVPEPSPGAAGEWTDAINRWHSRYDAEMKKDNAFTSSGECNDVWTADDGAQYFTSWDAGRVWWVGLSEDNGLQRGLTFSNVFVGNISGNAVSGEWADVPRGRLNSSGALELTIIRDSYGYAQGMTRLSATGGFGATHWKPAMRGSPSRIPITNAFDQVKKNQYKTGFGGRVYESLHDNLHLIKDSVALFGTLIKSKEDCPQSPTLPLCSGFPGDSGRHPRSFAEFKIQAANDADITFDMDIAATQPGNLFDGMSADDGKVVKARLLAGAIHCELVMFGRPAEGRETLLPGWAEEGAGNSVLINGSSISGEADIDASGGVRSINGVQLALGDAIAVVGTLVQDCGHYDYSCACHPCEGLELHPVYSIEKLSPTGSDNVSGTWLSETGSTIYLHQVGTSVWSLVVPPYRDQGFATVIQGAMNGGMLSGQWHDVPFGTRRQKGAVTYKLSANKVELVVQGSTVWGMSRLTKVRP
jgi:hypothetical protein